MVVLDGDPEDRWQYGHTDSDEFEYLLTHFPFIFTLASTVVIQTCLISVGAGSRWDTCSLMTKSL